MHGDDVASAGVEVTTQIVSKATEIFMEMLKIAIEREREKNRLSGKSEVLSGGEVTYQKLKEGGEVTMLPSFAKEDYGEFLKQAKKMDIPVAAIREQGKDNTLSVFFNVKDKEAVNSIVQGIVREKMKAPEQTERMITIEKEQVEGFQTYCAEHDIPVNFMETSNDVKCIFNSAYEKQIAAAVENYRQVQNELSKAEIKVQADIRGRPKIIVNDFGSNKKLTVNFCSKSKLERILRERLGFDNVKAIEAANALVQTLSAEQKKYFLNGSRQLEQMDFYQKDIKFENENVLTDKFSFAKLKLPDEDFSRLTITDSGGNFVVLSEKNIDREQVEKNIRAHLKLDDTETVKAVMGKAERLGFAEKPKLTQFKEYQIERETQSAFTVRGGNTVVRLDLSDKETAKKQLTDSFGISSAKAEKIIGKAMKQSVAKVGRVKTPVLNIIAKRDEAIAAFTKVPFYKVVLENGAECEKIFETSEKAEEICRKCSGKIVTVFSVKSERKKENRPLLHSLTSLQREANDMYGMTAADTLKAAQSLYEKKLITYPRTDSNYLSDDMISLVDSIVKCLANYDRERVSKLLESGLNIDNRIIDNGKISDHHAIIPTNLIGRIGGTELSEGEKNVAELVICRFLCALDKPYFYTETKYEFTCEDEIFKLTVKAPVEWGWKRYSVSETEESPTVNYSENDTFTAENISVKQGETQPPKRFTESSLLAVMENIDRLIPDKTLSEFVKERGLGTPATRAAIIEELIAAGYIERKKKQLVSTEYGRKFAASLPENVKSAELTAHWEQALSDIENGVGSADGLLSEIVKNVLEIVELEKGKGSHEAVSRTKTVGTCPRCGKPVIENSKGFSCSAGRENCGFFIFKSDKRIGRNYTAVEISELLSTGRVTLKNCVSSNGNKYSAVFSMDDTGTYVNLRFEKFAGRKN